jgi:hypothetical protein
MTLRIEDYALIGDCKKGCFGRPRRLDRLVVLAAISQNEGLWNGRGPVAASPFDRFAPNSGHPQRSLHLSALCQ